MIVHRAFTSGVTPVLICVYTLIGRVARRGPLIKMLITTSSMDIANARSDPDITAGIISGRMIQEQMTKGNNWPFAAALAVVLMVLTTLMIMLYRKITNAKELEGVG